MSKKGGGDGVYTQQFTCYSCGKVAYKNGSWLYRRGESPNRKYFCGYNCMRAFDKEQERRKEEKKKEKEAKKAEHDKERSTADSTSVK